MEREMTEYIRLNLQRFDEAGEGGEGNVPRGKEEIAAALKGLEGGEGFVSGFNRILSDAAKSLGKIKALEKQLGTLGKERESLTERYNKIMDFAGIPADAEDLDAKLEELREQRKKNDKNGADNAVLQSKLNELTRQIAATKKERDEHKLAADKRQARIQSIIRDGEIRRALKSCGALEDEVLVPLFRDKVKVLDDETTVYPLEDGAQVTVAEGVKLFFEKHPRLLKNNQNPGAGSGGMAPGKIDFGKLSQKEYEKMRKEGKL